MTDSTIEKLAFLILGWLLGLLAPVIADVIRRKRENALGRAAIRSEKIKLSGILSTAAYGARIRLGTAGREFLSG